MYTINVNGSDFYVDAEPNELLVWVINEKLGLIKTKFGCGIEMCGACLVLVDGKPTRSCTTNINQITGKKIVTREALPADYDFGS